MLVFVVNVVKTARTGRRAAQDPWQADTLEWYATSPPPAWNFDRIPTDHERAPAARPARGGCAEARASTIGPVGAAARGRRGRSATGLAVVSGAAGWGTAHRLLAGARAAAARRARRARLDLGAAAAAGGARVRSSLFGLAALLTEPGVHLAAASLAFGATVAPRRADLRGDRAPAGVDSATTSR